MNTLIVYTKHKFIGRGGGGGIEQQAQACLYCNGFERITVNITAWKRFNICPLYYSFIFLADNTLFGPTGDTGRSSV